MRYIKNSGHIQTAILYLILANIIWGVALPIYKWALEDIPPFTFVFLRFFISALILAPFVYRKIKIVKQDQKYLVIVSLISISLQIPLLFFGLKLTPSINAPIIISFSPIILIITSILFLKEKPGPKVIIGTLISLMGILAIILRPIIENGFSGSIFGSLLIFSAAICGIIQTIFLRKLTFKNDPLALTFWMFLIGSLPILPFVFWEGQTFNIINDITFKGFVGIIYAIYFSSILAHYFLAYGTKYIRASEVGIFSYVDPIATIAVAIPLLNEKITPIYILGALLVFSGIFIAENRLHYHPWHMLFNRNQTSRP